MLFEDIIVLGMVGAAFFAILLPGYHFLTTRSASKKQRLKDAREELELAKADLEAARLRKQAEHIYDEMYQEALQDENETTHKEEISKHGKE